MALKDLADSMELFEENQKQLREGLKIMEQNLDVLDENMAAMIDCFKNNEELKEMIYEELEELGYSPRRPRAKPPNPIIKVEETEAEEIPEDFNLPASELSETNENETGSVEDVSEEELKSRRLKELIKAYGGIE